MFYLHVPISFVASLKCLVAVAVEVQSVRTATCFSSVASAGHVASSISIRSNGGSIGEAVAAV